MIVLVQGYGEFDMLYVDSVWHNEIEVDISSLKDKFKDDPNPIELIRELKVLGFSNVKPKTVRFGGNL